MSASPARRRAAAAALMLASGFAGLGYQIIWTQQSALWLGHESAAVLAVITAFLGGLALGALVFGARIEATASARSWYLGCELIVALWSLLALALWSPLMALAQRAMGLASAPFWQWSLAFASTSLLFLPATAAMGVTLPAMERLTAELRAGGRSIASLYACNTAGAVLGVLALAFWLIPSLGLARSSVICAGLNLACAGLALAIFPRAVAATPPLEPSAAGRRRGVLWRLALTGLLGIGYEVLVVRVLSQVTEETVYTFALLLAVYLVGTAAGAASYRRWLEARHAAPDVGDRLIAALALACLLGTASLWAAEGVKQRVLVLLGSGVFAAVAAEAMLALLAFALPTVVMGALFSHLGRDALAAGVSFGRALGVNLLAAAAAPVLCGVIAVPVLGPKLSLLLVACGYLATMTRRAWSTPKAWLAAALAIGIALLAPPLRFVDVPSGGRIVDHRDGVMATVSVVADAQGALRLRIDNRQQEGSSVTRHVDARQAWLPLLLHPAPERALFLGLGTGVTAAAAADDPALEVDAVELLPEVIALSHHFVGAAPPARLRIMAADARRYVRATERRYDVIVADNFHPARSGTGALYTLEHFQALQQRLAPGGLLCQWLPLHQLDLETLRSIVRSFIAVYPGGGAMLASNSLETPVLGLVATSAGTLLAGRDVRERVALPRLARALSGLALEDEYAVLGSFVAGPAALARFAGSAPANTDDRPIVQYSAPRVTYAPESSPRARLLALLDQLWLEPHELFVPATEPGWRRRLSAYAAARNRYLAVGRDVRPSARVEDMLAQVREPLLGVLRISADFRPAYDPLVSMAMGLARSDLPGARALLGELARLQPARDEARELLSRLGEAAATVPQR